MPSTCENIKIDLTKNEMDFLYSLVAEFMFTGVVNERKEFKNIYHYFYLDLLTAGTWGKNVTLTRTQWELIERKLYTILRIKQLRKNYDLQLIKNLLRAIETKFIA